MNSETISAHYDRTYFEWQSSIGEFGGWAGQTTFSRYVTPDDAVLDFGCGGGYLLSNLNVAKRVGVEVNPVAAQAARTRGIEIFEQTIDCPNDYVDVIISSNALEHTLRPLDELRALRSKLKIGGKCVFVVPCESIAYGYRPNDINHHLYSWSPMCLGNLFTEAGYKLIESQAMFSKWPPGCVKIARYGGRRVFELACKIWGHLDRKLFLVRAVGVREE
jgi:SAM-dependent methyltransferase